MHWRLSLMTIGVSLITSQSKIICTHPSVEYIWLCVCKHIWYFLFRVMGYPCRGYYSGCLISQHQILWRLPQPKSLSQDSSVFWNLYLAQWMAFACLKYWYFLLIWIDVLPLRNVFYFVTWFKKNKVTTGEDCKRLSLAGTISYC